jgi:hypothetical protein
MREAQCETGWGEAAGATDEHFTPPRRSFQSLHPPPPGEGEGTPRRARFVP